MNELTLSRKIIAFTLLSSLFLAAIGIVGWSHYSDLSKKTALAGESNGLLMQIDELEKWHFDWMIGIWKETGSGQLNDTNMDANAQACDLIKWLSSPERGKTSRTYPGLGKLFDKLEQSHLTLNQSVIKIKAQLASQQEEADRELAVLWENIHHDAAEVRDVLIEIKKAGMTQYAGAESDLQHTNAAYKSQLLTLLILFLLLNAGAGILLAFYGKKTRTGMRGPQDSNSAEAFLIDENGISVQNAGLSQDGGEAPKNRFSLYKETIESLARGDFSTAEPAHSFSDPFAKSLCDLQNTLNRFLNEMERAKTAMLSGNGTRHADSSQLPGRYNTALDNLNDVHRAFDSSFHEIQSVMEKVAAGDLSIRLKAGSRELNGELKQSLNKAIATLDSKCRNMSESVDEVVGAASGMSDRCKHCVTDTSEQARFLDEISRGLHEMATMTKQNTSTAQEAQKVADATKGTARTGVDNMNDLSHAMEKIKNSSDETSKIVKTIDEIAFQTNLLALNAAVEAARAGEAGKGFAVVAEEVRNLAMRSAEAARETARLIENSVQNAEQGVMLNEKVLASLEEMNAQVNQVSEMMAEITEASRQQSEGILQIGEAVEQINQMSQCDSVNSAESSKSTQALIQKSETLRESLCSYRIKRSPVSGQQQVQRQTQEIKKEMARPVASQKTENKPELDPKKIIPFDDEGDQDKLFSSHNKSVLNEF
ncbi:hypothetical protein A2V82_06495 [candidate division KSB1 bacterium RBG_16_48_16]|nr:MAG: hypothetical protein A2V82_06495 [candidate division KSB1 bacterium RBG_16_48_16]